MRKAAYVVTIVVASALGTYLVTGYGQDDRGRWRARWVRSHLVVIQNQLAGLKSHLLKYKDAHGRYPTNDEGLAALDNFEARFETYLYRRLHESPGEMPRPPRRRYPELGGRSREVLQAYRSMRSDDPQEARQRLLDVLGFSDEPLDEEQLRARKLEPVKAVLVIGDGDNIFVLGPTGALSPWLVPYVYENRNGLSQAKFEGSPADSDKKGRYSVRVDDGVYVSSVGGQLYAERLDRMWWKDNGPRFVGAGLLLVAVVFLVMMIRTSKKAAIAGAVAMLLSGVAGFGLTILFGLTVLYIVCYGSPGFFSYRDPKMIARQKELLVKYHSRGVLGDQAYKRALSALERSPTIRPTTAPKSPD